MRVSYAPLWETLEKLKMSRKDFQILTKIGSSTMTKLRNEECITTDTLLKICIALKCDLNDIILVEKIS